MGNHLLIVAIFQEQSFAEFALLLRCSELELKGFHSPYVVHAKHALLHLSGDSGDGGVCWVDLWGEAHLVAPPKLLLGVAQLGLPKHGVQVRQCNLGSILLHLTIVESHCGPCSADSSRHQQCLIPQAQLSNPGLNGLLRCPEETKLLQTFDAQPEQGCNYPIIQREVVTQLP